MNRIIENLTYSLSPFGIIFNKKVTSVHLYRLQKNQMMKKFYSLVFCCVVLLSYVEAQQWIDTKFEIETTFDVPYGSAIDFAGNREILYMDFSYPVDDTIKSCGRPAILLFHGGAFVAGSRNDGVMTRIREDFARRGYFVASASYRLGQFHTNKEINCNISQLGVQWNCLNMADTSEWYRAYYRAVQDGNGALRFLVSQADSLKIDRQNLFVVGESAGGFIAMGVSFIDDQSEVRLHDVEQLDTVGPPHQIYEAPCIQAAEFQLDTSIASMDLSRPDLGPYHGSLYHPAEASYSIKAVGNFYGGAFDPIFLSSKNQVPDLYLYHQPNDLIVPFNRGRIFAGLVQCARQFGCGNIVSRPQILGSNGIVQLLDSLGQTGNKIPEYYFDRTSNRANCLLQISNPSLAGHAIDNYQLRTKNMAEFFSSRISSCSTVSQEPTYFNELIVYPNPASSGPLTIEGVAESIYIDIYFSDGRLWQRFYPHETNKSHQIPIASLCQGAYYIVVYNHNKEQKIIKWIKL